MVANLGLVLDRSRAASLHLNLRSIPSFGLMFSFGLDLGFTFDACGVFAAGLPFGMVDRDAPCGPAGPRLQLGQPRGAVILNRLRRHGLVLRTRLRRRPGIRLGRAFDRLEIGFGLAPPPGSIRLGLSTSPEFGSGLPGGFPGAAGAGGPLLVSGVAVFQPLPVGGQLPGESPGTGRAGLVVLHLGVCSAFSPARSAAVRACSSPTSCGTVRFAAVRISSSMSRWARVQ